LIYRENKKSFRNIPSSTPCRTRIRYIGDNAKSLFDNNDLKRDFAAAVYLLEAFELKKMPLTYSRVNGMTMNALALSLLYAPSIKTQDTKKFDL
jgi:hypothetical protein